VQTGTGVIGEDDCVPNGVFAQRIQAQREGLLKNCTALGIYYRAQEHDVGNQVGPLRRELRSELVALISLDAHARFPCVEGFEVEVTVFRLRSPRAGKESEDYSGWLAHESVLVPGFSGLPFAWSAMGVSEVAVCPAQAVIAARYGRPSFGRTVTASL
jgi:hypothetical protein